MLGARVFIFLSQKMHVLRPLNRLHPSGEEVYKGDAQGQNGQTDEDDIEFGFYIQSTLVYNAGAVDNRKQGSWQEHVPAEGDEIYSPGNVNGFGCTIGFRNEIGHFCKTHIVESSHRKYGQKIENELKQKYENKYENQSPNCVK